MSSWITSACPHDCPSACSLEVEKLNEQRIGKVRGNKNLAYTDGVICAKVARYAERIHHPDRLAQPLRRKGAKGDGDFEVISWDNALDEIAEAFISSEQQHGSESVWPYHSGGTMGIVQRWGLDRLRHVMRYSGEKTTICVGAAGPGWCAGVGKLQGTDPSEIEHADLIVVWGANPVSTQVNLMRHIQRARKQRGAKLMVVDCYQTPTMDKADIPVIVRPGSDAALACAMMHVMLEEGLADHAFLDAQTDFDDQVREHLRSRDPAWASAITGLAPSEIVRLGKIYGQTPRAYLRVGFGFTRSRNGATAMHAVSALPAVSGAWRHLGGGAFFLRLDNWGLDTTFVHGIDQLDPNIRVLDQSRIGSILCGDQDALAGGPPVAAMLMQNANSANVAPDSHLVRNGLTRPDLFLAVHEQFMTPTAQCADIVLPASMSFEYDDIYYGLGHSAITYGPAVIEPYAECRSNHDVVCAIAKRLGSDHDSFEMSAKALIARTLKDSKLGDIADLARDGFINLEQSFADSHFSNGFPTADGRFRFKPNWSEHGQFAEAMPNIVDHWQNIEHATAEQPFRLVTPPARMFLNTSFTETPSARAHEGRPTVVIHPEDAAQLGINDGDRVCVGNGRGRVELQAACFASAQPGVLIAEGIWPNRDHRQGFGINHLTGSDPVSPGGGVAFHDNAVWIKRIDSDAG